MFDDIIREFERGYNYAIEQFKELRKNDPKSPWIDFWDGNACAWKNAAAYVRELEKEK